MFIVYGVLSKKFSKDYKVFVVYALPKESNNELYVLMVYGVLLKKSNMDFKVFVVYALPKESNQESYMCLWFMVCCQRNPIRTLKCFGFMDC